MPFPAVLAVFVGNYQRRGSPSPQKSWIGGCGASKKIAGYSLFFWLFPQYQPTSALGGTDSSCRRQYRNKYFSSMLEMITTHRGANAGVTNRPADTERRYSITSSARSSMLGGTVRPS